MGYKIAVYGSAVGSTDEIEKKALLIGKTIADSGCVIVTGGCLGLPYKAAEGALNQGGKIIAYSPAKDIGQHENYGMPTEFHTDYVFTPEDLAKERKFALKYRNVASTWACDAGIIVGGRIGTLHEFTSMYDYGKVIGVLVGSGGSTEYIEQIVKMANKDSGSTIIYEEDPIKLVKKMIDELKARDSTNE